MEVCESYSAHAPQYISTLGHIDSMSPIDRRQIAEWGQAIDGRILDAGSGPGHWTAYLHQLGARVEGVDMVPEFVASASARFPEVSFRVGMLDGLPVGTSSLAGILAWYSVIHTAPSRLPVLLGEFARCLSADGSLLIGFFEGPRIEPFDHAVTTAYFWPVDKMTRMLERADFSVTDVQTRTDPWSRPHAAIVAKWSS